MRLDNHKEQNLVRKLIDNDKNAFEEIFESYKGRLHNFICKSLPLEEDAESIVQDIFVSLWMSRDKLDETKSLKSYLFTIAKNKIYDHLRKLLQKRKYVESIVHTNSSALGYAKNDIEYWEFERYLYDHIEKLPNRRREIYKLSKIEGISYREIAKRLNISENTVDMQMRNANATIKNAINQYLSILLLWLLSN